MKRFLTIIFSFIIFSSCAAFAEGDLWDNYGDPHTYGQKAVSDKEFDKALESKKKKKKRNKNVPKGNEFHQSNETQFIKEAEEEMPVLCIPVKLQVGEDVIPIGHYQVDGEKKDGNTFLNLYQAHFLIASIPATETQDDYGKETVHFVELLGVNDTQVKIIFGSLELNAYSIINIAQ
ncbi:MAG: hypothetical protein E7Z93_01995 [Cyanobacteria bacterium SIG32]|nr:hypothetical protein [Cyanobacteria bacterium SIG32]